MMATRRYLGGCLGVPLGPGVLPGSATRIWRNLGIQAVPVELFPGGALTSGCQWGRKKQWKLLDLIRTVTACWGDFPQRLAMLGLFRIIH